MGAYYANEQRILIHARHLVEISFEESMTTQSLNRLTPIVGWHIWTIREQRINPIIVGKR